MREIVLYPDSPLTQKAQSFSRLGPEVEHLAREMFEAMETYDGVGLAGPQLGIGKRILVLCQPQTNREMCLINPDVYEQEGQETAEEGCLSLPHVYAQVPRATRIRVRALSERGEPLDFEAEGLLARIIQHETDHVNGLVFLDRLDILTRETKLQEWAEVRRQLLSALTAK